MIATNELKKDIERRFLEVEKRAIGRKKELFSVFDKTTEDENICLKYLYSYMSEQDLANYDGELFLKFVRHSLMLREKMPWKNYLKDELFLNYVLQYRVNNENIEFYSEKIYDELMPIIGGKSMYDAVVDINYWCFSKATYQATDGRTISPLGIIKRAYGRCGEESTFSVSALRSVGIPARQVYSPRWAHCDDNHAWTEAFIDGEWHFLGACEPEPILDTGWFMLSASKGMLTNTRVCSHNIKDEEIVLQTENSTEINTLKRYAKTKRITVKITDENKLAIKEAKVRFEVLNYSEFYPLAEIKTDENGEASLLTGLGDLFIYAHKDEKAIYKKIDVRKTNSISLSLPNKFIKEENEQIIYMTPPTGKSPDENKISDEMKKIHEKKNKKALDERKAYESTFYNEKKAREYAIKYKPYDEEIAKALENARGNYKEIIEFIEDIETKDYIKEKAGIFSTLNKKDFCDIEKGVLLSHLKNAIVYKADYEEKIFTKYLLAPRISLEMITPFRKEIKSIINDDMKDSFIKNPSIIAEYINKNIQTKPLENSSYFSGPAGLLKLGYGREMSKKLLFVAICRTYGIPSRINKEDGSIGYYKDGIWKNISENKQEIQKNSILTLIGKGEFDYYKNYTVGILKNGVYETLDFNDIKWENEKVCYSVEKGRYRVVVSDRDSEGRLAIKLFYKDIKENAKEELRIDIKRCDIATTKEVEIKDKKIMLQNKGENTLQNITKDRKNIIAYLDVGTEPTEHLLNEFLEAKDKFNKQDINILLFIQKETDIKNATLQKVISTMNNIKICVGYNKNYLDHIYVGFEIQDKKLPFVYIMNKYLKAQNAWSGYNVGVGEMLLKYLGK